MTVVPNPATHDHGARHVNRVRMRVPDPAMRMRVENILEEALRLTTLPGEDQGRLYFFRRLQLPELDLRVPPLQWISRCSQRLLALSHNAQYACAGGSASAAAVYFHDQHEPRSLLLSRLLAGENPREWYWPEATGVASDIPPALRVEQILEQWRVQPAAWAAVARELLPSLTAKSARNLLELMRPMTAQRWLAAMSSAGEQIRQAAQLPLLRAHGLRLLNDVRLYFEESDPRLLFFAVLAVLDACPALPQDRPLVTSAARVLQQFPAVVAPARDSRGRLLAPPRKGDSSQIVKAEYKSSQHPMPPDSNLKPSAANIHAGDLLMPTEHRTAFAGLFFLLHPLQHLGVAKVLEDNPQMVLTHFVSRVLLRLALAAGVEEEDPVLLPLLEDLAGQKEQPDDPLIVPATLSLRRLHPSPDLTERLWVFAVRRWCRQHARMSVRRIVGRPGRIYATPVNLDITMPMTAVDLNLRRCGLDLDPGYVPWFGRVVHFHYHVEAQ